MRIILALATLVILTTSCASETESNRIELADVSLREWLKKNDPEAELVNGVYMRFIERTKAEKPVKAVLGESWIYVNYTAYTINGTVITSRNELTARNAGVWASTTHFCDDYFQYATRNTPHVTEGFNRAIAQMSVGDSVRVYVPMSLSFEYSMYGNASYINTAATYAGMPVYFDIRLNSVVEEPLTAETDSLDSFVKREWAKYTVDSIDTGLAMRRIIPNPTGDTITKDSTIYYNYAQYFLDGFLIDTNMDSVAKKYNAYDPKKAEESYYIPSFLAPKSMAEEEAKTIFKVGTRKMRRGETAEFITISVFGQGNAGTPNGKPEVLPYQPTIYRIYVLTREQVDSLLKAM